MYLFECIYNAIYESTKLQLQLGSAINYTVAWEIINWILVGPASLQLLCSAALYIGLANAQFTRRAASSFKKVVLAAASSSAATVISICCVHITADDSFAARSFQVRPFVRALLPLRPLFRANISYQRARRVVFVSLFFVIFF